MSHFAPTSLKVCIQLATFFFKSKTESLISITKIITSVKINSSRVDLNASIMYAGNLLIKPTVSAIKNGSSSIVILLVVVESVVKSSLLSSFDSPVNLLNNVVFPADVYPANDMVLNPCLFLDCR